uniref:Uncharacterized protein n=1 Tax=Wuchereria bancrofti TaxID=6293 RepID=A0A1I8EWK8_WUCBA
MLKATSVLNTDLINNVGNLLQRSTIEKLNPSQTYPAFHSDSFRNNLLELGEPLIEPINCLTGISEGFFFPLIIWGVITISGVLRSNIIEVYEEQFDELMIYKAPELLMDVMRQANDKSSDPLKLLIHWSGIFFAIYICYEVLRIWNFATVSGISLGIKESERGLDNVKIITDSRYFGTPLVNVVVYL